MKVLLDSGTDPKALEELKTLKDVNHGHINVNHINQSNTNQTSQINGNNSITFVQQNH